MDLVFNLHPLRADQLHLAAQTAQTVDKSTHAILPPEVLEQFLQTDPARSVPKYFRLTCPSGAVVHLSVLEFTAPAQHICLPPHVYDEQGLCLLDQMRLRAVRIPSATWLLLQPLSKDPATDINKTALEIALQQHYHVLEVGSVIYITPAGYPAFRVIASEPARVVSTVDTDITVELEMAHGRVPLSTAPAGAEHLPVLPTSHCSDATALLHDMHADRLRREASCTLDPVAEGSPQPPALAPLSPPLPPERANALLGSLHQEARQRRSGGSVGNNTRRSG